MQGKIADYSGSTIQDVVDKCLSQTNLGLVEKKLKLRRAKSHDATNILHLVKGLATYEREPDAVTITAETYVRDGFSGHETGIKSMFYCVLLEYVESEKEKDNKSETASSLAKPCGMALWFIGYSTLTGPYVYLVDLFIETGYRGRGGGKALMYALTNITHQLNCKRLVWKVLDWNTSARKFYSQIGAKTLEGTLTLGLDCDSIAKFLEEDRWQLLQLSCKDTLNLNNVQKAVSQSLDLTNTKLHQTSHGKLRLRKAVAADVPEILRLIQAFAADLNEPHAIKTTIDMLNLHGFGRYPMFQCILIDEIDTNSDNKANKCRGFALWHFGYSTGKGRYVYLEDLYIKARTRGLGAGKAVMFALSEIASLLDCARFVRLTLHQNSGARSFYSKIGAKTVESWLTMCLNENSIKDSLGSNTQN